MVPMYWRRSLLQLGLKTNKLYTSKWFIEGEEICIEWNLFKLFIIIIVIIIIRACIVEGQKKSSMKGSTRNPKEYQEKQNKMHFKFLLNFPRQTSMPIRRYIEVDYFAF